MPEQTAYDHLSNETALILFCDLQTEIVKHSGTATPKGIASSVGALFQLAQMFSIPAIISVVPEGHNPPKLISELNEMDGYAPQMLRTTASLFQDEATAQAIEQSGRRVLVVAGFMMEAVVLATVLDARTRGLEVLIAIDACGSSSQRTEHAAVLHMESAGVVLTSVVSIGIRLSPDFSTQAGQRMFAIVQGIKPS
ncbi:MAG: isochorismatase family protein [Janthinobacterium lividum]